MKRRMVLNLLSCKDLKTENRALSINLESVGSVSGSQFRASLWAAGAVGEFKQSGSVRLSTCSPAKRFQSFFFKQGYLYHCAHESTHIKTQNDLKCCEEQAKKASYITPNTKKCWPIKSLQTMTSKKSFWSSSRWLNFCFQRFKTHLRQWCDVWNCPSSGAASFEGTGLLKDSSLC